MSARPWALTVGGADVSPYALNGARFAEEASSTAGHCAFVLNGVHASVVVGASILLSASGTPLWEGTVRTVTPQTDSTGNTIALMILGDPLAKQLDVSVTHVSRSLDVAALAASICAQTPVPFSNQADLGSTGGMLSIRNAASGLTAAALIARKSWRVQNAAVAFIGVEGVRALDLTFSSVPCPASNVHLVGGIDSQTQTALLGAYSTGASGSVVQAAFAELADHDTLNAAGAALAQRYGPAAFTANATLPAGTLVRAGDWFSDSTGRTAVAHRVTTDLTAGVMVPMVDFGFPALPVANPLPDSPAVRSTLAPPVRLSGDYLVQGAAFSASGLQITLTDAQIVLDGARYALTGQTLTLPADSTLIVQANASGFAFAVAPARPAPGRALQLYVVTTGAIGVLGFEQVAPAGGIGNFHLKSPTASSPTVSLTDLTLVAEGSTAAKATIQFSIAGAVFDETIGSLEIVQSIAGEDQWGNPHVVVWSPDATAYVDYRHGLQAGQGYDLGVVIRGRNGEPLAASPLLIGTSPTISASAIAVALTMDQIADTATRSAILTTETHGSAGARTVAQLNDGANTRTASNVAAIIGTDDQIPSSSPFKTHVPNSLSNLLSDVGLSYSSTTSSVSVWITNAAGSTLPSWTYPDGSGTISPSAGACGSSGTPYDTLSGMSSGQNAYFVIKYNVASDTFTTIYKGTTPPTDADVAGAVADGELLAVQATANSNSAISATGGTGTKSGGGGKTYL